MGAEVDTSREAVERIDRQLATVIERIARREDVAVLRIPADPEHDADLICLAARHTLLALLARAEAAEKARDAAIADHAASVAAAAEAMRASVKEIVGAKSFAAAMMPRFYPEKAEKWTAIDRQMRDLLGKIDTLPIPSADALARRDDDWQPIDTAPRDGTLIDLWIDGEFPCRWPDCFWGYPEHCCGEMGQHCDSDWHSLKPGWVDGTFNEPLVSRENSPTHWRPIPQPPAIRARAVEEER